MTRARKRRTRQDDNQVTGERDTEQIVSNTGRGSEQKATSTSVSTEQAFTSGKVCSDQVFTENQVRTPAHLDDGPVSRKPERDPLKEAIRREERGFRADVREPGEGPLRPAAVGDHESIPPVPQERPADLGTGTEYHEGRAEINLYHSAIRRRWPSKALERKKIMDDMIRVAGALDKPHLAVRAASVILAAERADNQLIAARIGAQGRRDAAPRVTVNVIAREAAVFGDVDRCFQQAAQRAIVEETPRAAIEAITGEMASKPPEA